MTSPITETDLRQKFGIPADARQVLLFAESTHWDPNWLRTSQEYYQQLVAPGLEQVVQELRADPRRVYSLECMFYLRLFWDSHPELQDELRDLLNTRRLRLTGTGVTTPDTLIPSDEAILRDLLVGQEWLRAIGVTQEPRLAYFPDCFGHSPNLPALLNAAGFDRSAVTRIDGMWFLSADLDLPGHFPLAGSSAERLLKRERCLDFTWQAADGAQVLCHWNAFTYGQGDMLAYSGSARIYLYPSLAKPDRSDKRVAQRVGEYVRQLAPLSRTPYLFCPIGWDFNPPIPRLGELLDRYNQTVYPTSGVWLLNAGMDDYLDLIEPYRAQLPTLNLDPNPYWTGFYTARPALKQRAFRLVEQLLHNEQMGLLCHNAAETGAPALPAYIDTWWPAAVSNHHDLITGTSPDRVAQEEQIPMLDEALRESRTAFAALAAQVDRSAHAPAELAAPLPSCQHSDRGLQIHNGIYDLMLSWENGGQIEHLWRAETGEHLLARPAHQLIQYNESGGLWRMGYEYRGGRFREAPLAAGPVKFTMREQGRYLCISWTTALVGESLEQTLWIGRDDPLLYVQVTGRAPQKSTLVMRYQLPYPARELTMEAPGGLVTRPPVRIYAHPFWPVQRFLQVPNRAAGSSFAVLLRFPGAVSVSEAGQVEVITQRNAIREKAYLDLFNLLGMPATGIERERTAFQYALAFPTSGGSASLPAESRRLLTAPWASAEERLADEITRQIVAVDSERVFVTAVKPAWRGEGIILRLSAPEAPLGPVKVHWKSMQPRRAWLCDARERDLAPLEIEGQDLIVPIDRAITSIRVV